MASFEKAIIGTFKAEGGYQAHPEDNANFVDGVLIGTARGISAQAWVTYYKRTPTVADIKAITEHQAKLIFKGLFWDKVAGDLISNQSVAELMFQYVIGSGSSQISDIKDIANTMTSVKAFVSNDSPLTKGDAYYINGLDQRAFHAELKKWRFGHYERVVSASIAAWEKKHGRKITEAEALAQTKKKFHKGWINRLNKHVFIP